MEKIKVLQIVPNMQQGGLENLIMNILRNVDKNKFEFHFLYHYTSKYYFDNEIENLGGIIHKCSFREDNNIFKYIKFLKKFFKEYKFDVVHSHMLSTSFFTLKYAKKNGCKKLINHAHNSTTEKSLKGLLKRSMIRIASKNANIFLACSKEAGNFAYNNDDFIIINNCIDIDKFKFSIENRTEIRKELKIKDDEILIGNIGRLNVQKNQKFLIEAFSKTKRNDIKLVIIGDGELKKEIVEEIEKFKMAERIILISNVDTAQYYSAFDCFILCSVFEGFPLTAVEAQANGCYSIFSNVITNDVKLNNNIIFLNNDILEWVNKFEELVLNERVPISEKVIEFDIKNLVKKITNIYSEE